MDRLNDAVARALDASVVSAARLGGGDVAESYRLTLDDGRTIFAKTHRSPPPGFFTTEANGLAWLRDAGAIAIPEVLAVSDGANPHGADPHGGDGDVPFLALEWIEEGRSRADTEIELGRSLAALHRAGAPSFGRDDRRTTGSRALPNDPCDTWVEFYATRRLTPLARLARDGRALDESTLALLTEVTGRLAEVGGPPEPPARLHGDLWAGNRLVDTSGRSWLIDPASHGGHREFDLAMMHLFGGYGAECFEAYEDVFPLADGWQQRIPLHQLAPLAVHAIKFGGGYAGATRRALESVLRG